MKTIEITLYKFNELSEEAKQYAIQKSREDAYNDGDGLYWFSENCEERLMQQGFISPKVQYRLSYSQGDGLSFSAESYTGLLDLFKKHTGEQHPAIAQYLYDNCHLSIKGNTGHYCYASKSDIDLYLEVYGNNDTPRIDDIIEAVQSELTDIYLSACSELENDGYAQIEYEDSDEYIIERLEANEYDFTEKGEMY